MSNLEFFIKQNDTAPSIAITVINKSTKLPLSLVGATAKFSMRIPGSAVAKVSGVAANVYDAANGKIKYDWTATDTNTIGEYEAEFEVVLQGGGIVTFPQDGYIKITILDDI